MSERYVCDRNGGNKSRYLRRAAWTCPRCDRVSSWNGHICQECRHRVCCECFHHDIGCCLSSAASDVAPTMRQVETCAQSCRRPRRGAA